jgi:hypothetical protein
MTLYWGFTASNTVLTGPGFPITVGNGPSGVGIVPPPPGVPFLAFAANLVLAFGGAGNQDFFALQTSFILSSTAPPLTEPVTLQIGTFAVTIPPGTFKKTTQAATAVRPRSWPRFSTKLHASGRARRSAGGKKKRPAVVKLGPGQTLTPQWYAAISKFS